MFVKVKYPKATRCGLAPIGTVLAICISMIAKVISGGLLGIDAYLVGVEADISLGLPALATVGLPDGAVKESKDRVKAAIKNSGYNFPSQRITVNLAPADRRKEGASFDLPIAVGSLEDITASRHHYVQFTDPRRHRRAEPALRLRTPLLLAR